MGDRQTAIRIAGVKKYYRLGTIGGGTLQADLESWWARVRGKEDPNRPVWMQQRLEGQNFMALNGIDLTVYKGEALGIIGSNGAGKSTLLKLLSRVTAPTEGDIDIWGRVSSMLEIGTGFHGELTGRENIYMNGAILGMKRAEINAKIEDIIDFSEVRDFIDTPVKRYSSGMFVKLAFSVAAHLNSEIMIMDEVLAVGDMAFQQKCLDKMREAATQDGRTVLYVSHNMNTIRRLCDRCVVLDAGKVVFDGEVEKAIAVYMDRSLGEDRVDIDLDGMPHSLRELDTGLRMKHLTLEGKVTPVYGAGEDLILRLRVEAAQPFSQIRFRLTLRNDGDVGLGTAWSGPLSFDPGESEVVLALPLASVEKGIFYVSIGFYRTGDLGQDIMLDHITRAFKFEVGGTPVWSTSAHGYFRLPEIECRNVTNRQTVQLVDKPRI
jgi:lipopolysaccharide transport system ATP-binding protein